MRRAIPVLLLLTLVGPMLHAQDTLKVTLRQADSLLASRNLSLIAFRYEIDKAEARTIQQKLFNNPSLYTEWSAYNPTGERWLDAGSQGQKILQLQQVFRIAGQRKTSIRLAAEEKKMTQWQYYELARELKYELHSRYYRAYFLNNAITRVHSQLLLLKDLIEVYKEQYEKGNISLQELTRLNSTYFGINNQVNEKRAELVKLQESLQLLLADARVIWPEPAGDEAPIPQTLDDIPLSQLSEQALASRPELKSAQSVQAQSEIRYSLEKKEAVPDLVGGVVYDQAGSYIRNYTGASIGLQIPLFNRNQGRIQEAKLAIQQSKTARDQKEQEITREVESAWRIVRLLYDQYNSVGSDFETRLDQLSKGLVSNYSKNNISLLEFTDLFESYNSNILQFNQLKADLNNAYEELKYAVGEDL